MHHLEKSLKEQKPKDISTPLRIMEKLYKIAEKRKENLFLLLKIYPRIIDDGIREFKPVVKTTKDEKIQEFLKYSLALMTISSYLENSEKANEMGIEKNICGNYFSRIEQLLTDIDMEQRLQIKKELVEIIRKETTKMINFQGGRKKTIFLS